MVDSATCEAALREVLADVEALGDTATACHLSMALETFLLAHGLPPSSLDRELLSFT